MNETGTDVDDRGATAAPRSRRGRPPLSRERLITAAVALLDEVGADAFGLRELADRLDSGTATLYRHFSGKREILDLVLDKVFEEIAADPQAAPSETDPLARIRGLSLSFYRMLLRHPHVAPLLIDGIPTGAAGLAAREAMLSALLSSGFPAPAAARIYTTIAHYVIGFAIQARPAREATVGAHRVADSIDQKRYPAIAATLRHLPAEPEEEFQFGLELILAGLAAAAPAGAGPAATAPAGDGLAVAGPAGAGPAAAAPAGDGPAGDGLARLR